MQARKARARAVLERAAQARPAVRRAPAVFAALQAALALIGDALAAAGFALAVVGQTRRAAQVVFATLQAAFALALFFLVQHGVNHGAGPDPDHSSTQWDNLGAAFLGLVACPHSPPPHAQPSSARTQRSALPRTQRSALPRTDGLGGERGPVAGPHASRESRGPLRVCPPMRGPL